jgi:hypothetical protein
MRPVVSPYVRPPLVSLGVVDVGRSWRFFNKVKSVTAIVLTVKMRKKNRNGR